jgi:hypothetical protein
MASTTSTTPARVADSTTPATTGELIGATTGSLLADAVRDAAVTVKAWDRAEAEAATREAANLSGESDAHIAMWAYRLVTGGWVVNGQSMTNEDRDAGKRSGAAWAREVGITGQYFGQLPHLAYGLVTLGLKPGTDGWTQYRAARSDDAVKGAVKAALALPSDAKAADRKAAVKAVTDAVKDATKDAGESGESGPARKAATVAWADVVTQAERLATRAGKAKGKVSAKDAAAIIAAVAAITDAVQTHAGKVRSGSAGTTRNGTATSAA